MLDPGGSIFSKATVLMERVWKKHRIPSRGTCADLLMVCKSVTIAKQSVQEIAQVEIVYHGRIATGLLEYADALVTCNQDLATLLIHL
jgi:hypothetical protein